MGPLDSNTRCQPPVAQCPHGRLVPACRRTTTSGRRCAPCPRHVNTPTVMTHIIIVIMLCSSWPPTGPRHRRESAAATDRRDRPLRIEGPVDLSERRRAESRRHSEKKETSLSEFLHCSTDRVALSRSTSPIYFCWPSPSSPRAQRKPVPWVWSANPPRPLPDVVISASGLCQEPPRIERTTPFLSGPCGLRSGACL